MNHLAHSLGTRDRWRFAGHRSDREEDDVGTANELVERERDSKAQ